MVVIGCALAALVAAPALAQKPKGGKHHGKANAAGSLDTTFGEGGKVTVAFPAETEGDVRVKYDLPYSYPPATSRWPPRQAGRR
jgi:hypothetical protein